MEDWAESMGDVIDINEVSDAKQKYLTQHQ
jgi:hypothetical protein